MLLCMINSGDYRLEEMGGGGGGAGVNSVTGCTRLKNGKTLLHGMNNCLADQLTNPLID